MEINMTVSINKVYQAAQELLIGGSTPNVKFALQIAACSAQQSLSGNGRMARVIAKYVHKPLPAEEVLRAELKEQKVGILNTHISAIYWAEYLEDNGLLDPIQLIANAGDAYWAIHDRDTIYKEQMFIRSYIYDLYHPTVDDESGKTHGYGMAYKTISFALFLLFPLYCEVAILDRHHLNRLIKTVQTIGYGPTYIKVERELRAERALAYPTESLGIYGWWAWENWRQAVGASEAPNGTVETHALLSARWY
jgi:hypothetical protein